MRSSKSRSRSKSNRPRSIGNIINRVFDSSGPDGKVRGTPQQLIEKYQFLARDAQLSNDRVAAENFQQHAEHYTRMLGEAQRELAADQDARRQPGDGGQNGGSYPNQANSQSGTPYGGQNGGQNGSQNRDRPYREDRPQRDDRPDPRETTADLQPQRLVPILGFADEADDSGLVETPETRQRHAPTPRPEFRERPPRGDQPDRPARAEQPARPAQADPADRADDRREHRKPRNPAPPAPHQPAVAQPLPPVAEAPAPGATPPEQAPVAAAEDAPPVPRRARAPRKPRAEAAAPPKGPAEAAE